MSTIKDTSLTRPIDLSGRSWERRFGWLLASGAALAVLALFVHLPLESSKGRMHMAYYNLGNKFRELERFDEAIAAYRESLRETPRALSTHNNLALAYELAGRRREAIEAWRTVLLLSQRAGDRSRMQRAQRHLHALGTKAPPDVRETRRAPAAAP